MPFRVCGPRSSASISEPTTRSRTVLEAGISPGAAAATTRAAICTPMPPTSSSRSSTSPACRPARTCRPIPTSSPRSRSLGRGRQGNVLGQIASLFDGDDLEALLGQHERRRLHQRQDGTLVKAWMVLGLAMARWYLVDQRRNRWSPARLAAQIPTKASVPHSRSICVRMPCATSGGSRSGTRRWPPTWPSSSPGPARWSAPVGWRQTTVPSGRRRCGP
jgi:hypothetical protein